MSMTLYYNRGSCSLASHVALEETGLDYSAVWIDLTKGSNYEPEYLATNRWARVPALECSGGVLTENVAILQYLADLVPDRKLLPAPGTFERAQAVRFLALLSSTIHVAFRPLFRPSRFVTSEGCQQEVVETGLAALNETLQKLEGELGGRQFVLGDEFSLCDAYALVFAVWSRRPSLEGKLEPTPALHAIGRRVADRPSGKRAMQSEEIEF
jgi:glutathione S-transferase